jgi:alpha-galactosidase
MTTKPARKHFFAASMGDWRVDQDIERLIRKMKKFTLPFSLWYVPTAIEQDYDIENYAPKVDGAVFLTTIYPKTK